jgi:Rrf2 family protein
MPATTGSCSSTAHSSRTFPAAPKPPVFRRLFRYRPLRFPVSPLPIFAVDNHPPAGVFLTKEVRNRTSFFIEERNTVVITRATEYAIRAVLYMAKQPPGQTVLKKDICKAQDVTPAFLTKILQPLIKIGIVGSQRGVSGGFFLAVDPAEITLLDVIEAEEGTPHLNICLENDGICGRDGFCPVHRVWREARSDLIDTLQRHSFADLVEREKIFLGKPHGPPPAKKPERPDEDA